MSGFRPSKSSDEKKKGRIAFANNLAPYSIRNCLESTDEADTYVALAADDCHEEHEQDLWSPIRITTDKVLDLNGHTLSIEYNRNRNNSDSDKYQNLTDTAVHNCWAFEITDGATLTIIDSSAWRGENDGNGTGGISFTGYMVDPFKWGIIYNTTRDLFHVDNGNLVVYGGTFEAYSGANVFNMIRFNEYQKAWQYSRDANGNRSAPTQVIRSAETPTFRYEVNAAAVICASDEAETYLLSDIQSGRYDNGVRAFLVQPYYATVGWDYTDYTTTNSRVAVLDQNGCIRFGGEPGEAVITVSSPDGKNVSKTVSVIRDYSSFEITGIQPPVIGEKLAFRAEIPEDAPYHITDIAWMKGSEPVGENETAEYYQPYTICVTVESDDFCRSGEFRASYSLAAGQADGSVILVSEPMLVSVNAEQVYDEEKCEYLQRFTFRYTYPALADHKTGVIDKVYMDFPTAVKEGDNFLSWLKNVHVYYGDSHDRNG